jgi:amidophosphoribosyltransferase
MCGIIGVVATTEVNQLLYDGLQVLQHRGQDAAGIATGDAGRFHMHKGPGLVRDVFRTRNMRNLVGNWGIGHCRYPTAGSAYNPAEAQPFYVNSPFGLMLAHNGNLTNSDELRRDMFLQDLRHMNTNSDSEVLLNVLAHELQVASTNHQVDAEMIFKAVAGVHRRVKGAYAVVAMIAGYGLLAFRDPYGIRPLVLGRNETPQGDEYLVASESVAIDTLGFKLLRDVAPGEAVLIDRKGNFLSRQCAERTVHAPCMFEYVYLARPDSVMDGISVYDTRAKMGEFLADKIRTTLPDIEIDAVIPIPDSSRHSAMELARCLNLPYREGFVKNRYIGRTFIMPGQATRKKSVRQKLNAISQEFKGRNVLLVDDSIVRGTTSQEIINMAREAGAKKVYFASASPPVRFANVYGIDMPSRTELIAAFRNDDEICKEIGADALIYQDIEALKEAVRVLNPAVTQFESSCFDGNYVTGDISRDYLDSMEAARSKAVNAASDAASDADDSGGQMDLNLISAD